ncbi:hypothetical protein D3C78_1438660 [compost metagenome]
MIQWTKLLNLLHLLQKILKRKFSIAHFTFHFFRFLSIDAGLRLLNQREHITHTKDTGCHTFWMERLQSINLLAKRRELNRTACYSLNG